MPSLPVILTLSFCFGGPHCYYSRPVGFHTWSACAEAGVSMVSHARRVGAGDVGFSCESLGGKDQEPSDDR